MIMKKLTFLSGFIFLFALASFAQADNLVGYWLTQDGDSQVRIFKATNGKYYGVIEWLKDPLNDQGEPKVDDKNPDASLHTRPVLGLQLLKDFVYNGDKKEWAGGTIYDPKSGKTYDAFMKLDSNDVMKLKGFVLGMRFLGREATWTRDKELRK